MEGSLPVDVRRFILNHIGSVEMLNVLLLVHDAPERWWTSDEVGRESRTNEWSAELQLSALAERGLVIASTDRPARFRAEGHVAASVAAVERAYRERSVAVITLIYSRPRNVEDSADK